MVMSQLELTVTPSGSKPYHARFWPVLVMTMSIVELATLFERLATTPGGKPPSEKLAMLPNAPGYWINGNWPGCKPKALILITRPLPGTDKVSVTLMAGAVGLTLTVP